MNEGPNRSDEVRSRVKDRRTGGTETRRHRSTLLLSVTRFLLSCLPLVPPSSVSLGYSRRSFPTFPSGGDTSGVNETRVSDTSDERRRGVTGMRFQGSEVNEEPETSEPKTRGSRQLRPFPRHSLSSSVPPHSAHSVHSVRRTPEGREWPTRGVNGRERTLS